MNKSKTQLTLEALAHGHEHIIKKHGATDPNTIKYFRARLHRIDLAYSRRYGERLPESISEYICKNCGNKYTPDYWDYGYCSDKCSGKSVVAGAE